MHFKSSVFKPHSQLKRINEGKNVLATKGGKRTYEKYPKKRKERRNEKKEKIDAVKSGLQRQKCCQQTHFMYMSFTQLVSDLARQARKRNKK